MSNSKGQSRSFLLIFYQEDSHLERIVSILNENHFKYSYILHDMDSDSDGVLKKAHYHFVINSNKLYTIKGLSSLLCLEPRFIRECLHLKGSIDYLTHKNDPSKYQYPDTDVYTHGTFLTRSTSESDDISLIFDYIFSTPFPPKLRDLYQYCISEGLWSSYRRNYSIIKDIINERNSEIFKKNT